MCADVVEERSENTTLNDGMLRVGAGVAPKREV